MNQILAAALAALVICLLWNLWQDYRARTAPAPSCKNLGPRGTSLCQMGAQECAGLDPGARGYCNHAVAACAPLADMASVPTPV